MKAGNIAAPAMTCWMQSGNYGDRRSALRRSAAAFPRAALSPTTTFSTRRRGISQRRVRFSELFGDKSTLITYSFMFGPEDAAACPSCTSILDALDGTFIHVTQQVPFVVIAKSPIGRIMGHARDRGWRRLRLLSSFGNSFNRDYRGEDKDGSQTPSLNVFVRRDGEIRHFYNTELMFTPSDPGQDPRHVDSIWPLWNLLDVTPEGRGKDWRPQLRY